MSGVGRFVLGDFFGWVGGKVVWSVLFVKEEGLLDFLSWKVVYEVCGNV